MTIECLEDGTEVNIRLTGIAYTDGTFQVQLNNGGWKDVSWKDIGSGKDYNLVNAVAGKSSMAAGDKLRFMNIDKWANDTITSSPQLKITKSPAKVYGKLINSLKPELTASKSSCNFSGMFQYSTALADASDLSLDGIALMDSCCQYMFAGCTSLVSAPELPAMSLVRSCYGAMFAGCTSLVNAPELPATTLARNCYDSMFQNCKSLTAAPKLPATELADYCYKNMFLDCVSLANAPALPATTLASYCYDSMFQNCKSLTSAPELPATTLASDCYSNMFYGCTSLTSAPELPATALAIACYAGMFYSCTSIVGKINLPATKLEIVCYNHMFANAGTANAKKVHMPKSLSGSFDESMFGSNTGVTVIYDL